MFWPIILGVLAVVLLAAWLYDRRAARIHRQRAISDLESPRQGATDGMTDMYGYGIIAGRQGGGPGGQTGGPPA